MKVEGKNATAQLIDSGINIDKILIQNNCKGDFGNIIFNATKRKIKIQYVDKVVLDKQSETKRHQGIIAYATDYKYKELDDIFALAEQKNESPFIVVCDEIEDPHNLGSLLRTCECAGVHGVIIGKNRCCQVTDTVIKVSTGAAFNVNVVKANNLNDTIRELKRRNVFVYALEADGNVIYNTNLTGSIALVVGSEGFGVSKLTRQLCDETISLPMYGNINSLNASVAGAICIYEAVKQRNKI